MRVGFQSHPDRIGMEGGRTRDVDEVGSFAVEHQAEVVVDAHALEHAHRDFAPRGDRLMQRDDGDVVAREPSGPMTARGDFAEAGNRAAQFHIQVRARSSSSR